MTNIDQAEAVDITDLSRKPINPPLAILMSSLNYFDYLTTGNLKSMIKELSKASPWLQKQMKTSNNRMIVDLDGGVYLVSYPSWSSQGTRR
jgi:hypothetical protein